MTTGLETLVVRADEVLVIRCAKDQIEAVVRHAEGLGLHGRVLVVSKDIQLAKVKRSEVPK